MSAKANPTVIGAFITGAIILAILGLLVFGSGRFFKKVDRYVAYFDGAVDGLNVGAPVTFRGVPVGSVKEIALIVDSRTKGTFVKVVIEIERGKAQFTGERAKPGEMFKVLLSQGLRAQLRMQSMVTGLLYIALDLMPDVPARLRGLDKHVAEIPVAPTDMEKLKNTLSEVLDQIRRMPIREMVDDLARILDGVERIVNASEVKESLGILNSTMTRIGRMVERLDTRLQPTLLQMEGATSETQKLVATLNVELGPLVTSLRSGAEAAKSALAQMERTLSMKEGVPADLATSFLATSEAARKSLDQATRSLETVQRMGGEDSQLRNELTESLKEMREAARSIRVLGDYLEQHPESLIRGKAGDGGARGKAGDGGGE